MNRVYQLVLLVAGLALAFTAEPNCIAPAQDDSTSSATSDDKSSTEATKLYQYFASLAKAFEARLGNDEPIVLVDKPMLKWTIGSTWHGSFYLWTFKDRPVLIGCFLSDSRRPDRRQVYIEMHSLADEPFAPMEFVAIQNYEWDPKPGRIPDLPVDVVSNQSSNPRMRRNQMRQIAESYSASMYEEAKDGNAKESLRMLTTPLYTYPDKGDESLSGAIYAFVRTSGTDPEFLLVVEYDPKSKQGWRVRPIRYTTRRLELTQNGKVVWQIGEYNMASSQSKLDDPYMIITLLETRTEEFNLIRDRMIELDQNESNANR